MWTKPSRRTKPERVAKEQTRRLRVACTGREPGEVDLREATIAQNIAGLLTLVAVVQDYHAPCCEIRGGNFCASPAERAVVINDKNIVLNGVMAEKRVDFRVHIQRRDE